MQKIPAPKTDADRDERTNAAFFLALRMYEAGRLEDALRLGNEALQFHRQRRREHKTAPGNLAGTLVNLGAVCAALGRYEEAFEHTKEALGIYRALAEQRPEAYRGDLARSLHNFAGHVSDLSRYEEAFEHAREALSICRTLAKLRFEAQRDSLAQSLILVANLYRHPEKIEDGLPAVDEALKLLEPSISGNRRLAVLPSWCYALTVRAECLPKGTEDRLKAAKLACEAYMRIGDLRPEQIRRCRADAVFVDEVTAQDVESARHSALNALKMLEALLTKYPRALDPDEQAAAGSLLKHANAVPLEWPQIEAALCNATVIEKQRIAGEPW